MTINTDTRSVTYEGDGTTTSFPLDFVVYEKAHLTVQLRSSSGALTTVASGDYSLTSNDDWTGTLEYAAVAVGTDLIITRDAVPYTQDLVLENQRGFEPQAVERQLDLLEMQIQQVLGDVEDVESRALRVPVGETVEVLPPYTGRANKLLGFDSIGQPTMVDPSDITEIIRRIIVYVAWGQSNEDTPDFADDGDQTGNDNVLVWNGTAIVPAVLGEDPFRPAGDGYDFPPNRGSFHAAKQIADREDATVILITYGQRATSRCQWRPQTLWAVGQAVLTDDYRYFGNKVYRALNDGTTGATGPTGTAASVSDGTVSWKYMGIYHWAILIATIDAAMASADMLALGVTHITLASERQGENQEPGFDHGGQTPTTFLADFLATEAGFRAASWGGTEFAYIACETAQGYTVANTVFRQVQSERLLRNFGLASSAGIPVVDGTHFSGIGQVEWGERIYDAWKAVNAAYVGPTFLSGGIDPGNDMPDGNLYLGGKNILLGTNSSIVYDPLNALAQNENVIKLASLDGDGHASIFGSFIDVRPGDWVRSTLPMKTNAAFAGALRNGIAWYVNDGELLTPIITGQKAITYPQSDFLPMFVEGIAPEGVAGVKPFVSAGDPADDAYIGEFRINVLKDEPNILVPRMFPQNLIYNYDFSRGEVGWDWVRGWKLLKPETGEAQDGATSTTVELDPLFRSAVDDFYNGHDLSLIQGDGAGQTRTVTDYNGTTGVATISPAWDTTPNALKTDLAAAVTLTSITIVDGYPYDDILVGYNVSITAGPGAGQVREIVGYNGTTFKCDVAEPWDTLPVVSSSMYQIRIHKTKYNIAIHGLGTNKNCAVYDMGAVVSEPAIILYATDYFRFREGDAVEVITQTKVDSAFRGSAFRPVVQVFDAAFSVLTYNAGFDHTLDGSIPGSTSYTEKHKKLYGPPGASYGRLGFSVHRDASNTGKVYVGESIVRALESTEREVNVLRYGADPTGVLDSYAAFVAAHAAMMDGGDFVIPQGDYALSAKFQFTKHRSTFNCRGRIIPFGSYSDYLVEFVAVVSGGDPTQINVGVRIDIRRLYVDGLWQSRGVRFQGCYCAKYSGITVTRAYGTAVHVDDGYECSWYQLAINLTRDRTAFSAPGAWSGATAYIVGDRVRFDHAAYAGGTTYAAGALVRDSNVSYMSKVAGNVGHTPASSPTYWLMMDDDYFECMIAHTNKSPYDATVYTTNNGTSGNRYWKYVLRYEPVLRIENTLAVGVVDHQYFYGLDVRSNACRNLIYIDNNGNERSVYAIEFHGAQCHAITAGEAVGSASASYDAATTYVAGYMVTDGGTVYMSKVGGNVGNTPASSPDEWLTVTGLLSVPTAPRNVILGRTVDCKFFGGSIRVAQIDDGISLLYGLNAPGKVSYALQYSGRVDGEGTRQVGIVASAAQTAVSALKHYFNGLFPVFTGTNAQSIVDPWNIVKQDLVVPMLASNIGNLGTRVRLSGNQSVPDATATSLSWATEDSDTDGMWVIGSPTIFTVPHGVQRVRVSASLQWAANATGIRQVSVLKNGAGGYAGQSTVLAPNAGASFGNCMFCATDVLAVAEGDTLEVSVYQNSGGALNVNALGMTWVHVERIL